MDFVRTSASIFACFFQVGRLTLIDSRDPYKVSKSAAALCFFLSAAGGAGAGDAGLVSSVSTVFSSAPSTVESSSSRLSSLPDSSSDIVIIGLGFWLLVACRYCPGLGSSIIRALLQESLSSNSYEPTKIHFYLDIRVLTASRSQFELHRL